MLWLSSYIQNWQMTKIDHLPTKHKLLHFTSSTPTIDVEPVFLAMMRRLKVFCKGFGINGVNLIPGILVKLFAI